VGVIAAQAASSKLKWPEDYNSTDVTFTCRRGAFFSNWIMLHTVDGWLEERHSYWFGGRPWADQVAE
jgi:hypothetical protein